MFFTAQWTRRMSHFFTGSASERATAIPCTPSESIGPGSEYRFESVRGPVTKTSRSTKGLVNHPHSASVKHTAAKRHVVRVDCDPHGLQLPGKSVDDLGPVAPTDVQPMIHLQTSPRRPSSG